MKFQVRKSVKYTGTYNLHKKVLWWWENVDSFHKEPGESLAQATDRVIGYHLKKKGPVVLEVER